MNPNSVLYILARNDLNSMNPGKLAAQCSHASNSFVYEMFENHGYNKKLAIDWMKQTNQGFGTAIVLATDEFGLHQSIQNAQNSGFYAKIVHDPTYPIQDGKTTHLIPLDTCGWVFVVDKTQEHPFISYLKSFPLYP